MSDRVAGLPLRGDPLYTLGSQRVSLDTFIYQDGLTKKYFGFRYYPVFKASCSSPLGGALEENPRPETKNPPLGRAV
jgi:hypothetical protein